MTALVLYTDEEENVYESLLKAYRPVLPPQVQERAGRFRRWQDRQAYILGRLLIWQGLQRHGYGPDCLDRLKTTPFGKPYIDQRIFFNLSHSGRYVICIFSTEETGIDIEEMVPTDLHEFNSLFTEQEKEQIYSSAQPLKAFFRLWTIKESVIKAEGKGLSIPLQQLDASRQGLVQLNGTSWHIKELEDFKGYCCAIAGRNRLSSLAIELLSFDTDYQTLS